jgi:hypothetical protein
MIPGTRIKDIPAAGPYLPTTKLVVDDAQYGTRTITVDGLKGAIRAKITVATVAALKAMVPNSDDVASTKGYHAPGDGGHGVYRYVSELPVGAVANDGTWIASDTVGFWGLVHDGRVTVRQFGAKGDGSTDDTAHIQAALDDVAVTTLEVPSGVFRVAGLQGSRGLTIQGAGTLRAIEDAPALRIEMPWQVFAVQDIQPEVATITSPWNTTAITCADHAQFRIGDVIKVTSNDPIVGAGQAGRIRGEFAVVALVADGKIYTTAPLRNTFPTSPRVVLFDRFERLVIRGIGIRGGRDPFADPGSTVLVDIRACVHAQIDGVRVSDAQTRMVTLRGCFGSVVTSCVLENAGNLGGAANQFGYGVETVASANTTITGCTFRNLRHGVDCNPALLEVLPTTTGVPWQTGGSDHTVVTGCTAYGCSNAGFSTHGASYGTVFDGCVNYGSYRRNSSASGFDLRGENLTAVGCVSYNSRVGFQVFSDGRFGPERNIRIVNCEVRGASFPFRSSVVDDSVGVESVEIDGGVFEASTTMLELPVINRLTVRNARFVYTGPGFANEETSLTAAVFVKHTSNVPQPQEIILENNEFDLRLCDNTKIQRFFSAPSQRQVHIRGKNNRFLLDGVTIAVLFNTANNSSTLEMLDTFVDAAPTLAANANWASTRWELKGAVQTKYSARNVVAADNAGWALGRKAVIDGSLDKTADDVVLIPMSVTAQGVLDTVSPNALQPGMFQGQQAVVSWRARGDRSSPTFRIPAHGHNIATDSGWDINCRPGESARLVWDATIWRATQTRDPRREWWQSLRSIKMLSGAGSSAFGTNRIRAELTGLAYTDGQPWTVSWAGTVPALVPANSVGLFQVAPSGTNNGSQNTRYGVIITSVGTVQVRATDATPTTTEWNLPQAVHYLSGRNVSMHMSRRRGTLMVLHADGLSGTFDSPPALATDAGLSSTFSVRAGAVSGFAGENYGEHFAIAFWPLAFHAGTAWRLESTWEHVIVTSDASSPANDTVPFRSVDIANGTPVVPVSQGPPEGLTTGTTYYVRHASGQEYTLHATEADALSGANVIDITGSERAQWLIRPHMLCVMADESGGTVVDRTGNGFDAVVEGTYD